MRSVKVVIAAVAGLVLLACNTGQPRIYKVAIDASPLGNLPATCYVNNELPNNQTRTTYTNLRLEQEWVIWDGVENKQYLDMGSVQFGLGDAAPVVVAELIEGTENVFSGSRTDTQLPDPNANNHSSVRTRTVTVAFDDQGTTPTGTITVLSNYTCTNCFPNETEADGNKSCTTQMKFVGHRVDTQRISVNE